MEMYKMKRLLNRFEMRCLFIQQKITEKVGLYLGDLREKFSRKRSDPSVSLSNHLKQRLLPGNS